MVHVLKAARKAYNAPTFEVLDPVAAKTKLATVAASQDGNAREMLSVVNQQLKREASVAPSVALNLLPQ